MGDLRREKILKKIDLAKEEVRKKEEEVRKKEENVKSCEEELDKYDESQGLKVMKEYHVTPGGLNIILSQAKADGKLVKINRGWFFNNERVDV